MPFLEIMVFIGVGVRIGLMNTISFIILTTVAGAIILRMQGLSVLSQAQATLKLNTFSMEVLFDKFCIFFAGVLLVIPGFISDIIGLLILFPPIRLLLKSLGLWFIRRLDIINLSRSTTYSKPNVDIIDGDFHDVTKTTNSLYKRLGKKK